ncbi:MAG: polymerase sigma-70 factor, subfamily [Gaiellaceae bacterium]|nr:polymerase sigma-70 factor, subfamily [Gaiellaceae bacterium]
MFLNAHRCLEEGIEPQSERAWLFKIAEHVVMYRRRTISRRARVEFPIDVDSLADLVVAPGRESPSELDALPEALARIPEAQQRAIVLREWYGLSYREVATELGISASAAETLIFRARRRLAQELGGPAPTVRRRTQLGLVSPLASLGRWLFGGTTALKAIAGVTSVAVIAAGTSKVGLLERPAPRAAMPSAPQSVLARVNQAVSLRTAVSDVLQIWTAGARVGHVGHRPGPATVASAPSPSAVATADPVDAVVPADSGASASDLSAGEVARDDRSEAAVEPDLSAPVEALAILTAPPVVQLPAVDGGPVDTPPASPGQSGNAHGPNGSASSGQAQRSDNVPANAADPGSNGQGTPAGPGGPPAANPGNNGQGTPGGPANPQAANPGSNGQGTPGGPAGPPPVNGGDPPSGNTLPQPPNEGAPDLSALPDAAKNSESQPVAGPPDSNAQPVAGGDGQSPAQAQTDPAGPAPQEASSPSGNGTGGAGNDVPGLDSPSGA